MTTGGGFGGSIGVSLGESNTSSRRNLFRGPSTLDFSDYFLAVQTLQSQKVYQRPESEVIAEVMQNQKGVPTVVKRITRPDRARPIPTVPRMIDE